MLIFFTLNQLFTDVFKNNASRSEAAEKRHNQNYFMEMITVEGVYDYLMYVGTHRVSGAKPGGITPLFQSVTGHQYETRNRRML